MKNKIGQAKSVQHVIDELQSMADDVEEVAVLYTIRGKDGIKQIDHLSSGGRSRIWTMGALEYLKLSIYEED